MDISCEELFLLRESTDFEAKSAQGQDGAGAVPNSVWATYSAMANTNGGIIILGADELNDGSLEIVGIMHPAKVLRDFWNTINNPTKVNQNILQDHEVQVVNCDGRSIIAISVPRANRNDRPVFIGGNPLTGSYQRRHEGDYRCDENSVRRMIADSNQETRDHYLLEDFTLVDLDQSMLSAYRNEFRSTLPGHPWLSLDDQRLLEQLGGWRRDRISGTEGITAAGLLMFGRLRAILDAFPNYIVDYQERPDERKDSDQRWLDRVTTDGTWSGNLYDFYRRVYPRLTADLRVPFRLRGDRRVDETHVHEALREALVNTLIHADFSGTTAIRVLKYPHVFSFRNPGGLRLPLEIVLSGGTSDCRNRNLQKMFQMVGAVEQAGSGVPKILRAWSEKDWRRPTWREHWNPDQTELEMGTHSLLPTEVVKTLSERFGEHFEQLDSNERLAIVIAHMEGAVTNLRLQEITEAHPTDLTRILGDLVAAGMLNKEGVGRGSTYELPSVEPQASLFHSGTPIAGMIRVESETVQPRAQTAQANAQNQQPVHHPAVVRVRSTGRVTNRAVMEDAI